MWSDNDTNRDFLNFTGVAETVAEVIHQSSGQPISIGISGAWGIGKSSMIRLIRHAVEQRDGATPTKYIFVEFNAWLYQGYDDARAALMDVIASTLAKEAEARKTGIEKVGDFLKRVDLFRAAKLTVGSAVAISMGLPPVGLVGEIYELGRKAVSGSVDEKDIVEGEAVAGKAKEAAGGLLKPKRAPSPPKEIHALRKSFEDALKAMDVKLIVLIDDLDRCLPETTISTLEAIRLFLFLQGTAFVIAADEAMIKHAVRKHFDGVEDAIVTSYFDKLIQLPIRVPPLGTQEVRAYMMLLFVDNSEFQIEKKETIRTEVCRQLGQTWRGKRVDRAFIQTLDPNLPGELLARFEVAERLAPIMTSASQIAGNPRLVKRFLNALSVRMAISRAQDVGVDEAVLAKLLLFERCAGSKAYAELAKSVNDDVGGKPSLLVEWEEKAHSGKKLELESPWDGDFIREWLSLAPRLADLDLRGALYVSREHVPMITPEDRLTSEGAALLSALLAQPDMAAQLKPQLEKLSRGDMTVVMDKLLARAHQDQEWGVPDILEACLTVVDADPSQGSRLAAFLRSRPSGQIKASIVPRIQDYAWAAEVFSAWEDGGASASVKKAIKQRTGNGNVKI